MTEHPYLRRAYAAAAGRDPGQTSFLQALEALHESVGPALEEQPLYTARGLPERLGEPEQTCLFPVAWTDDRGRTQVTRGIYLRFSTVLGPPRTDLVLRPGLDLDRAKALALELTLCRALAGLSRGAALAGADAAPEQMSDGECLRFCRAFMEGLYPCLEPGFRPGQWEGQAPVRETALLAGQYERLCALTGGAPPRRTRRAMSRSKAAGHGLVFFAQAALRQCAGERLEGQTVLISGCGAQGAWTGEMAARTGAKVAAFGDETGCLWAGDGLPLRLLRDMAEKPGLPLLLWAIRSPGVEYRPGPALDDIPADVVFLCPGHGPMGAGSARRIMAHRPAGVFEGAPQAATALAGRVFSAAPVYAPGLLAGAGVEVVPAGHDAPGPWETDRRLRAAMEALLREVWEPGQSGDLSRAARAAAFRRLADAMLAKGI